MPPSVVVGVSSASVVVGVGVSVAGDSVLVGVSSASVVVSEVGSSVSGALVVEVGCSVDGCSPDSSVVGSGADVVPSAGPSVVGVSVGVGESPLSLSVSVDGGSFACSSVAGESSAGDVVFGDMD